MVYSEDVEIIKELMRNVNVNLYDLHLKYRLSPAQVSNTVKTLLEEGVISIQGESIGLTERGREWIVNNRKTLFLDGTRKYWKQERVNTKFAEEDLQLFEYTKEIQRFIEEDEE